MPNDPRQSETTAKAINWRRVKRDAKKAQKVRMRELQECIAHARRQS